MSVPQHNNSVYFVVIVIVRTKNYCVTTAVLQFTKEILTSLVVEHSSTYLVYILTYLKRSVTVVLLFMVKFWKTPLYVVIGCNNE